MFCSIWVHLGSFRNCMKLGAKHNELVQLLQKFVSRSHTGFFATKSTNPPHWTLYQCFSVFHSIWVHLGSFCYCMKLVAKLTELVQLIHKFVPRSHIVIFATNAPGPPHWTLNSCFGALYSAWVHLGSFRNSMKLDAK